MPFLMSAKMKRITLSADSSASSQPAFLAAMAASSACSASRSPPSFSAAVEMPFWMSCASRVLATLHVCGDQPRQKKRLTSSYESSVAAMFCTRTLLKAE